MRRRQTFTLSDDLLKEMAEFRWRNRIPSLSRALEILLRRSMWTTSQASQLEPDDPARSEREINNRAYTKIKKELMRKKAGTFAVIALGKLQGYAATFEGARELLNTQAPDAKHAIVEKIGEKVETEAVWQGIDERIR